MRTNLILIIAATAFVATNPTFISHQALVVAAEPTTAPAAGVELEDKPFKDPQSGIELRLPKGWVRKQGIEHTGYQSPTKDRAKAGGLSPNVVLTKEPAPGVKPTDVGAIVAGKRKQYAKLFTGYKDEETGSAVPHVSGKGVGRIDCSWLASDVLPVHAVQIWIVDKDQVYTITFTSLKDTYASNAKVFDAVAETIEVP